MGLLDSFFLLGLFLVGLPLAWAVGWVLEKVFRLPILGVLPIWIVIVTLVAGIPIALSLFGVETKAVVTSRHEVVHIDWRGGGWWNKRELGVRYLPAHPERADPLARRSSSDSVIISLAASEASFDRAPVGAIVPVTYISFRPSIGKLTDRTLGDLGDEMMAIPQMRLVLGLVALVICSIVSSRWAPRSASMRWARRASWVVLATAGGLLFAMIAFRSPTRHLEMPVPSAARARVARVERIDRYWFSGRHQTYKLAQPFDVVELEFTPQSFPALVTTADAMDIGSVQNVAVGATIPIHYDPATPRVIRIDGATRTFERANERGAALDDLLILLSIVAVIGIPMLFRRRSGGAARPAGPLPLSGRRAH